MTIVAIVLGGLIALWVLAHLKTSRPDGTLLNVHPYRRIMQFLMPTRTESLVFMDEYVDAENLLAYLEKVGERLGADVTHATVAAANLGVRANPAMNRFAVGRRLYQRKGRFISFSMKRKALDRKAKMSTVKMKMDDEESFADLCRRINEQVTMERSGERTAADKEFAFFNLLPRPVFSFARGLLNTLDYFNLVPGFYIEGDPLYTTVYVANLGSLGMPPAFHHLYEYGTCPLFMVVGRIEERPVVVDGAVIVRKQLHIRYTYDERIADGLTARYGIDAVTTILLDPERYFACAADDGTDARPMNFDQ